MKAWDQIVQDTEMSNNKELSLYGKQTAESFFILSHIIQLELIAKYIVPYDTNLYFFSGQRAAPYMLLTALFPRGYIQRT